MGLAQWRTQLAAQSVSQRLKPGSLEQIWPVWAYKERCRTRTLSVLPTCSALSSPPTPCALPFQFLEIPRSSTASCRGAPKPGKLESTARNLLKARRIGSGTRGIYCACVQCHGQPGLTLHLLPTAFHYSIQTQHGPWEIS